MKMYIKKINNVEEAKKELEKIGVHKDAISILSPKMFHYNIKVKNLQPQDAIIIKQEMLCCGGDAAIPYDTLPPKAKKGDAIIMGNASQIERLVERLKRQYKRLSEIGEKIDELMGDGKKILKIGNKKFEIGKKSYIMGILNVTPDSFYDGGKYFDLEKAIERAKKMEKEGADIIDIGGESTRPFSKRISIEEEIKRVIPVIEALNGEIKIPISIDTYKPEVAEKAIEKGAKMINDVMALRNGIEKVVKEHDIPVVIMHMKGKPETMQINPYYEDVMDEIIEFLEKRIKFAVKNGINEDNIITDPGIGFGKRHEDNIKIISHLYELKSLGHPILIGVSRKSFIGNILKLPPEERLEGSIAAGIIAIANGADIIRCHDVKETKRAIMVADEILR